MKKKITLTIDDDVYDMLGEIPRKVSVSEVTSWFLKLFLEEIKLGREITGDEVKAFYDRTPEGRDFRQRFNAVRSKKTQKKRK